MPETSPSTNPDDLGHWKPISPRRAPALLGALPVPWWISGGWAIDLHIGRTTRDHHDLDIGLRRADLATVREALAGWEFHAAENGVLTRLAPDQPLSETANNVWCRPSDSTEWLLDFQMNAADGDTWQFRRDRSISKPLSEIILNTKEGLPYLAPEVQLLFKAKGLRSRDEMDFKNVRVRLSQQQKVWLADALDQMHPDHPWTSRLRTPR